MKSRNRLNVSTRTKVSITTKILATVTGALALLAGGLLLTGKSITTETTSPGNWSSSFVWSNGVPVPDATVNIYHSLTLDNNIDISAGTFTINAPVADAVGGNSYSISITGSSSDGLLDVNANLRIGGRCDVDNHGVLIVRSGDTLVVGGGSFANNSRVTVEAGGVMIVNGDLVNENNSSDIVIDGELIVNGNFTGGNGSVISGNGSVSTTGSMTGAGTVFGSSPLNCSGPCDGRALVGFTNTIGSSQNICSGQAPATLTGTTSASGPSYQWQKSTDNSTFSNISGATSASYSPGSLTATTYFRRIVVSGRQSSVSASVSVTVSRSGVWTGAVSSKWNTAGNWCGGSVPLATDNVIINAGSSNMPSIPSGTFNCNSITIASGATLTLESGSVLNIKGNVTNKGTITDNGGTMVFNGTAPQSVSGVTVLKNLTVNNTYGLTLGNALEVNGIIRLLNGALISNGLLTVNFDGGGIAYADTDKGSIYGKVTFKRTIASNKYHYLSSPLTGQTIADWNDNISIGSGYTYYYYDESDTNPDYSYGWTGIRSITTPLTPMMGYAIYFTSAKVMDNTGTYTHGQSPYSINLDYTRTGSNGADGWNLVGNPYPSTIDWDNAKGWTKTNVYNAVYCWDGANERYTYYINGIGVNGGSRYIAPMQAFWVRVDTTKSYGTLKVNSYARSTAGSRFYKNAMTTPMLKIAVDVSGHNDETVIRFMDDATEDFDGPYDAFKMMNEGSSPSLYSSTKGMNYAINSIPEPTDEMEIPLMLTPNGNGTSKLSISGLDYFDDSYSITLEDKALNVSRDLRQNPEYEFTVSNSDDPSRFTVKVKKTIVASVNTPLGTTSSSSTDASAVKITLQNKSLVVRSNDASSSEATLAIYSMSGSEAGPAAGIQLNGGEGVYDMSRYPSGMYIVKVLINKNAYSQKVYLP